MTDSPRSYLKNGKLVHAINLSNEHGNGSHTIRVTFTRSKISIVEVNFSYLKVEMPNSPWVCDEALKWTTLGSRGRQLAAPKESRFRCSWWVLKYHRLGTGWMGNCSTLLPLDQGDFAMAVFSLARPLEKASLGKAASNSFLIALTSSFGTRPRYDASITASTFRTSIPGFLFKNLEMLFNLDGLVCHAICPVKLAG
jgi:hypothetical protein